MTTTTTPVPHRSALVAGVSGNASPSRLPLVADLSRTRNSPYWLRDDPYWEEWMWDRPPAFTPKSSLDELAEVGTGRRTTRSRTVDFTGPDDDPRLWRKVVRSAVLRRTVAVLDGFHHATTKQLAAAASFDLRNSTRTLGPGFNTGLLNRGRFSTNEVATGRLTRLWALWQGENLGRWATSLSDADRLAVFGPDRTPHAAGPHTRHDVLLLEAVLRLLEVGNEWAGLTGEPHSAPGTLCPWLADAPARLVGDAVLWRNDGLRVVVELCASRNLDHVERKMRAWASWLGQHGRERTGTVVVFLNAHRDKHTSLATNLRKLHEDVIAPRKFTIADDVPAPVAAVERAADAIHLASWEDWFPVGHRISEAGAAMTTLHRVRQVDRGDGAFAWTPTGLASAATDDQPFTAPREYDVPTWEGCPSWVTDLPLVVPDAA